MTFAFGVTFPVGYSIRIISNDQCPSIRGIDTTNFKTNLKSFSSTFELVSTTTYEAGCTQNRVTARYRVIEYGCLIRKECDLGSSIVGELEEGEIVDVEVRDGVHIGATDNRLVTSPDGFTCRRLRLADGRGWVTDIATLPYGSSSHKSSVTGCGNKGDEVRVYLQPLTSTPGCQSTSSGMVAGGRLSGGSSSSGGSGSGSGGSSGGSSSSSSSSSGGGSGGSGGSGSGGFGRPGVVSNRAASVSASSSAAVSNRKYRVIHRDGNLNIRSTYNIQGHILGTVVYGDVVEVLETKVFTEFVDVCTDPIPLVLASPLHTGLHTGLATAEADTGTESTSVPGNTHDTIQGKPTSNSTSTSTTWWTTKPTILTTTTTTSTTLTTTSATLTTTSAMLTYADVDVLYKCSTSSVLTQY